VNNYDVYLYGMVSPSTVYVLRGDFRFPNPNTYAEIARVLPSIGGEAANSAIVLSKFGLKARLDGNWISRKNSERVLTTLGGFGIDVSRLSITEELGTEEIVIADTASRTVFGNYAAYHAGLRQWNEPSEEDIRHSEIACLDPYMRDESRLAARICVTNGKPYVTLDCRHDDDMARNAEAVVISHELRDQAYAGREMREVFEAYRRSCRGLTIFTFGSEELWYARPKGEMKKYTPYKIDAIDTTGAGDSFRGAVAYGIYKGWDDDKTVDFASAVAACVCLTVPHALNAPGLDGVLAFMEEHRARK
jgi:sugar/nucleoside kinase (ribokinase family)